MASPHDYTIGVNAAMRVANADIQKDVPFFFRGAITQAEVQQVVTDVVVAALDAVDESRGIPKGSSTPPAPPSVKPAGGES